jgi:hypothetical protein
MAMYVLLNFFLIFFVVGWGLIFDEVIRSLINMLKVYRLTQRSPKKCGGIQNESTTRLSIDI